MKCLLSLCLVLFCTSAAIPEKPKYPPLPEKVKMAKTVYLENQASDTAVFGHLYQALTTWGRWKIVGEPSQADLRLVLTRTSPEGKRNLITQWWYLMLKERDSDNPLLYISADIAMGRAVSVARLLVKKMRERIERAAE